MNKKLIEKIALIVAELLLIGLVVWIVIANLNKEV